MELEFVAGAGLWVTSDFEASLLHQGGPGLAHGGLLAAALDEALGYLSWLVGAPAVTARIEVDFRRPVPVGSRVYLHAQVTGCQDQKVYGRATGRLNAVDGPVAVSATGLFVQVPLTHFIEHGRGIDVASAIAEREIEVNP